VVMVQEVIYLQDVLTQMKTLTPDGRAPIFDIKVRTFNKYSKTGGRLLHFPQAKLVMKEENPNTDSVLSLRIKRTTRPTERKNPAHFTNKTRNIKILPQKHIKKIGIRHIIEFNNKKVIY